MRVVFMGTTAFAVPSLERLIADGHLVCGVFTQPDKPKNRGMKLTASPVKECALAHGIPVYQPVTLKDGQALEDLRALAKALRKEGISLVLDFIFNHTANDHPWAQAAVRKTR